MRWPHGTWCPVCKHDLNEYDDFDPNSVKEVVCPNCRSRMTVEELIDEWEDCAYDI